MKINYLLYAIIVFLFVSCGTQKKFVEKTQAEIDQMGDRVNEFSFDTTTTELYVRTVVKVRSVKQIVKYQKAKDKYGVFYELKNLESNVEYDSTTKIVEEQYLLYNRKLNKVLIINNVPNYFEKLFSEKDLKQAKDGKGTSKAKDPQKVDTILTYDIWRFNQFRFGNIMEVGKDSSIYTFHDVLDFKKDHVWYLKKDTIEGAIYLKRFAQKDSFNEDIQEIRPTYPFDMKFRRINNFNFVLKDNRKGFANNPENVKSSEITGQTMKLYRYNKQWFLVFQLTNPPLGMNPFVVFENGSIYAEPYFTN
ncbi:hypothetical protein IQ13_1393 [Lacibacter cauensis]|uniref:Lipoprotein n=1 Tax=Lacibacter cauensis TaxID=510947 RepID=A0A562SPS8_9BACT|nr:hypothetical protein [Lacibacter cauensis]TWI83285.1 hypothetical protein IQ13_1393 [Lacibacter cauensis]